MTEIHTDNHEPLETRPIAGDLGSQKAGHAAAFLTILIWGTTFISTKVLLKSFSPAEILFIRFLLGYLALCLVSPHPLRKTSRKEEIVFFFAGMCGICLYYLLENIALTRTSASNVGVIISIAPFFTAILSRLFEKGENKLSLHFFLGFFAAMAGICLIGQDKNAPAGNPFGDFLALVAALVWACYSILTRKISGFGYGTLLTTRRLFAYGLFCMLPSLGGFDFSRGFTRFTDPVNLLNLLFLGLGASALCFVTWNRAVSILGAVKTSVYIYMVPVVTVVTSVVILQETITLRKLLGIVLTLAGLLLSQRRVSGRK